MPHFSLFYAIGPFSPSTVTYVRVIFCCYSDKDRIQHEEESSNQLQDEVPWEQKLKWKGKIIGVGSLY